MLVAVGTYKKFQLNPGWWLWVLGPPGSEDLPSLLLDEEALSQIELMHSLGVLLDSWLLLKEQVAAVPKAAFVSFVLSITGLYS